MRFVRAFGLAPAILVAPLGAQDESGSNKAVALVSAAIYRSPDADRLENGVILIERGRITAVGTRQSVSLPKGTRVVDYSGSTIVAGFWNCHVHFTEPHWEGADTLPATVLRGRLQAMLTRFGFVRVLDTGSLLENTLALRRRIAHGEVPGPAILTTGPGFVPRDASPFYILPARLPELRSPAEAKTLVATRIREGADAIKLFTGSFAAPTRIVPMPEATVRAATIEAHRLHKPVVAHPSNQAGIAAAIEGGVDVLAHTAPEGGPWDASLLRRMRQTGIALIPTLKLWAFELSRREVDSATSRRFVGIAIEQVREFVENGGEVLFGTDVGYMTDYDPTEEYRYMERANMSFRQILAALTTAPARRFGQGTSTTGRVEKGMDADLVVLEGDPARDVAVLGRVRAAWRKGQMISTSGLWTGS